MGNRRKTIALVAIVAIAIAALAWFFLRPRQPRFEGKTVNQWIRAQARKQAGPVVPSVVVVGGGTNRITYTYGLGGAAPASGPAPLVTGTLLSPATNVPLRVVSTGTGGQFTANISQWFWYALTPVDPATSNAFAHFGKEAIPYLTAAYMRRSTSTETNLLALWTRLPSWLRVHIPQPLSAGQYNSAADVIARHLHEADPETFAALGRAVAPLLAIELNDPRPGPDRTVLGAWLQNLQVPNKVLCDELVARLKDPDRRKRDVAAITLTRVPWSPATREYAFAIPVLLDALQHDNDPYVRAAAANGLGQAGREDTARKRAGGDREYHNSVIVAALKAALTDRDEKVRAWARGALWDMDPEVARNLPPPSQQAGKAVAK